MSIPLIQTHSRTRSTGYNTKRDKSHRHKRINSTGNKTINAWLQSPPSNRTSQSSHSNQSEQTSRTSQTILNNTTYCDDHCISKSNSPSTTSSYDLDDYDKIVDYIFCLTPKNSKRNRLQSKLSTVLEQEATQMNQQTIIIRPVVEHNFQPVTKPFKIFCCFNIQN